MTIDEFITELSNLTHKTNVRKWLNMASDEGTVCPITSICKKHTHAHYTTEHAVEAAKRIGIRKSAAELIMNAADNSNVNMELVHPDNYNNLRKLRNRMLKAVGLPTE